MMESIAAAAMSMSAAQFATDYSLAVTKMTMEDQEAAQSLISQMMPQAAPPALGTYIDTYA